MITLATTKTIAGVAGTAAVITYSINGDALNTGTSVDSYDLLAQGQLGNAAATIYEVPATTQALVRTIHLANTSGSLVTGIKIYLNGTASTNQIFSLSIVANGSAVYSSDGWRNYDASGALLSSSSIALTGDITGSGVGTIATTLATVNASPGTTGDASHTNTVTVNAKGLVTSATANLITPAAIGAPAGSGTSTGTNTGDQTIGTAAPKNVGNTVLDPGTGKLEYAMPSAGLVTGGTKTYASTDRGFIYRRSNAGASMSDTLPTLTNTTADIGWTIVVHNEDTVLAALLTVNAGGGALFRGGTGVTSATSPINYGSRQMFVWDGTQWLLHAGNANLLRRSGTIVAGNFPQFVDSAGNATIDSGVSAATVAAKVASVTATDASVTVGGTATAPTVATGRLDQIATLHPPTAAVNVNSQLISGGVTPVSGTDVAIKSYVDSVAAGVLARHLATAASVANVASLTGLPTFDAITLTSGQIVLLTAQTSTSQNGLWAVAAGAWTRPTYFATASDAVGSYVYVEQGTIYAGSEWFLLGASPITVDTTAQVWQEVTGTFDITVDSTLVKSGNQLARAAITGDVAINASGNTSAIQAHVVTAAMQSQMPAHTMRGNNTAGTADVIDLTLPQVKTELNLAGSNTGDQTISITGDVTATGSTGALASTVVKVQGRNVVSTAPANGAVYQWVAANSDWEPFAFAGDLGGGPSAGIVTGLQGTAVSSTKPQLGMNLKYGPSSWQPTSQMWNVINFGADPTAGGDSTVAIYNAIISCGLAVGGQQLITSGTPTTSTGSFNVTVTANAAFASSGTGNLIAMTTRGLVYMTFTGGTTTTVACTVTAGVAGGTILAGSIMGVASTTQIGGIVYFPPGLFLTTQEITNSIPGIHFMGVGGSANADTGNWGYSGGSWLYYNGPIGGTVLRNVPIAGVGGVGGTHLGLQAGQALKGIRVTGLNASAGGTSLGYGYAKHGFQFLSCDGWYAEDLFVLDPAFAAYDFSVLGNTMLGEAADCTRGTSVGLRFRCLEGPATTAANMFNAQTAITAGAGINLNTFNTGASTPSVVHTANTNSGSAGSVNAVGGTGFTAANGNMLIATICGGATGLTVNTVPTGWNLLTGPQNPGPSSIATSWVYWKIAASEPSTWTWVLSSSVANSVTVSEINNVAAATTPLVQLATGAATTTKASTAVTTVTAGCLVLTTAVAVISGSTAPTFGATPASTTFLAGGASTVVANTNPLVGHYVDTVNQVAAGATTSRLITVSLSSSMEVYTVTVAAGIINSISTAALTAAAWPAAGPGAVGLGRVQAVDQLTGNVIWYLFTYTGNAGPGLTGVTILPLWYNQANATTLQSANGGTSNNALPNALLFTGALVSPAYAAYAQGGCMHGSLSANTAINTFIGTSGTHWLGEGTYLGNCDSNDYINSVFNRSGAGQGATTGIGWDVQGATAIGGASATSRNHHWISGDPGTGGLRIRGTGEFSGTAAYTVPATPNYWDGYELGNGGPMPVIGTGALFSVWFNGTARVGGISTPPTAAQALTASVQTPLTGSSIVLPTPLGLVPNFSWYRWYIRTVKTTAAGVATWSMKVCIGTANTNADTAVATWTSGTNTGIVDDAVMVLDCYVTSTTAVACTLSYIRSGVLSAAATGLGTMTATPTSTATYTAGIANPNGAFIHVDITPGAAAVQTAITQAEVMR